MSFEIKPYIIAQKYLSDFFPRKIVVTFGINNSYSERSSELSIFIILMIIYSSRKEYFKSSPGKNLKVFTA